MMCNAARTLLVCLLFIPITALADDVYPLNAPPDVFIDGISVTGGNLSSSTVETIVDANVPGCISGCEIGNPPHTPYLSFSANSSSFEIFDPSNLDVYLAGTLVAGSYDNAGGGEVGELFIVTTDNNALWTAQEQGWAGPSDTQAASSFGPEVVIDLHGDVNGTTTADLDLTPAAVPEPATLTLLFSGLAAGLLRKRMAGKRA
jgi:hypothetical protein